MLTINTKSIGSEKVMIDRKDFEELVKKAKLIEPIAVKEVDADLPIEGIMKLVESDKAFEFLNNPAEDIYSLDDLKERY